MGKGCLNRRGAETSPLGIIMGIIILAIVAFTVIYFFTDFFGRVSGTTELAPGDLESLALACPSYVAGNLKFSFCEFREVKKNVYVNCEFSMIQDNFEDVSWIGGSADCDSVKTKQEFCAGEGLKDGVEINGESCSGDYACVDDLSGEWKGEQFNSEQVSFYCLDNEDDITSQASDKNDNSGQRCCRTKA